MNKITKKICALFFSAGLIGNISAQSAVEALMLTDNDLIGTARFVGMGGAFTSLGGDISRLVSKSRRNRYLSNERSGNDSYYLPPIYSSK